MQFFRFFFIIKVLALIVNNKQPPLQKKIYLFLLHISVRTFR